MKKSKNRKRARTAKGSRVFDSIAAAAAGLDVDAQTLKRSKGAGCPAFVGSRVKEKDFLRWVSDNPNALTAQAGASLDDQKTAEQIRKLRISNDHEEGTLVSKAATEKEAQEIVAGALKILRQKLENEYPTAVAGMDPAQARIYGKRLVDDICAAMRGLSPAMKNEKVS